MKKRYRFHLTEKEKKCFDRLLEMWRSETNKAGYISITMVIYHNQEPEYAVHFANKEKL